MPIIGNLSSAGKKPTTPTIGTATDGGTGTTASVAFTPSTYIGKGTISYTALSNPGSITGTGSGSPITVSGLTTGTAYTFTVKGDTNYGVASEYSAASNSVTPASPSSFESIATVNGTGSSTTITFSSIPSTYKSLQLRCLVKSDGTGNSFRNSRITYNGDTGTNYTNHYVQGDGTSTSAYGGASAANIVLSETQPDSGSSFTNMFGVFIVDIIDYASTSKNKTTRIFNGLDVNNASASGGRISLTSGLWMSISAINSISVNSNSGNFTTTSTFALYGVK